MPLTFREVYDSYKQNAPALGDISLQDYSKIANYVTQSNDYSSGDVGMVGGLAKKASYYLDNAINATQLPRATGWMGENVFRAFGQNPETGRQVGEGLPRGLVDFAPLLAVGAAGAAAAPFTVPALVASGAMGALNAYGHDASKAGIAASALAPAVGLGAGALARGVAAPLLESAATRFPALSKVGIQGATSAEGTALASEVGQGIALGSPVTRTALNGWGDRTALYAADNIGAIAGTEGTQVALGEKSLDQVFTTENALGQLVGNIPFAIYDAPKLLRPQVVSVKPIIDENPAVTPTLPEHANYAARVLEYDAARKATSKIADPAARKLERIRVNEEFEDLLKNKKFTLVEEQTKTEVQAAALRNEPGFAEQLMARLDAMEKAIAERPLQTSEDVDNVIAGSNAITSKPITQETVTEMVKVAVETGATESEAAQAVAQAVINNAKENPVKPVVEPVVTPADPVVPLSGITPPAVVEGSPVRVGPVAKSPEALSKQQAGGKGRPLGDRTKINDEFNAYAKTEEGRKVEAVIAKVYPKAEAIRKGIPEAHQTAIGDRLINSVNKWRRDIVGNNLPIEENLKTLEKNFLVAIRQSHQGEPLPEMHPKGEDGVAPKYNTLEEAHQAAQALNDARGENGPAVFYNGKNVNGKFVVKAFKDLSRANVSMDASKEAADAAANVVFAAKNVPEPTKAPERPSDFASYKAKVLNEKQRVEQLVEKTHAEAATSEVAYYRGYPDEYVKHKLTGYEINEAKRPAYTDAQLKGQWEMYQAITNKDTTKILSVAEKAKVAATEVLHKANLEEVTKKVGDVDKDKVASVVQSQEDSLTNVVHAAIDEVATPKELLMKLVQVDKFKKLYMKEFDLTYMPTKEEVSTWLKDTLNVYPEFRLKMLSLMNPGQAEMYRPTFGGVGATGAPLTKLETALGMAQGKNTILELGYQLRDKIWKATGWNPAMDGSWRFEIDDRPSKLKFASGKNLRAELRSKGSLRLGDIWDHPELYEHYQQLANYKVVMDTTGDKTALGWVNSDKGTITLTDLAIERLQLKELKALLAHEAQHVIQKFEGFARGADASDITSRDASYQAAYSSLIERGYSPEEAQSKAAFEAYKNAHGEVESRDVEARMRMQNVKDENGIPVYEGKSIPPYSSETSHPRNWTVELGDGTNMSIRTGASEPFQVGLAGVADHVLSRVGWTKEQINTVAQPFLAKLGKILKFDGIQFGAIEHGLNVDGRELLGAATVTGKTRKLFLSASKAGTTRSLEDQTVGLAFNLTHELGHHIEQAAVNGLLGPEATVTREAWRGWALKQPGEWTNVLKEFSETLPKEWQGLKELQDMMQPANVEEFEASAHAIWAMGQAAKQSDLTLFSTIMPQPVRSWFRTLAKWGRDLTGAVKTFLHLDRLASTPQNKMDVESVTSYFENIKHAVNDANLKMAEFGELASMDSNSMSFLTGEDLALVAPSVIEAPNGVMRTQLTGAVPKEFQDKVFETASRSLVYLEQMAAQFPKMANAAYAVMGATWNKKIISYEALSPLYGKQDLGSGKLVIDPAKRPLLELANNPGRTNRTINEIHLWEGANKVQFPLSNPASASARLANRINSLTSAERQAVQFWNESKQLSHQKLNEHIIQSKNSEAQLAIANVLSVMTSSVKGKHGQLEQAVDLAMRSATEVLPGVKQNMVATWSQMLATGDPLLDSQLQQTMFDLTNTAVEGMTKLDQFLKSRPWYTPEIRTGSHLLRAVDANGKELFTLGYTTNAERVELQNMGSQMGATKFHSDARENKIDVKFDDVFTSNVQHFEHTMTRKLRDALPPNMQGQAESLVSFMNIEGEFQRLAQATKLNPHVSTRRLAPGREHLNLVTGWQQYINMMSNVLSNGKAQARMRFEFGAPELQDAIYQPKIKQIKDTYENYRNPDSELAKTISQVNAVYHLGFNVPTHIAELSQSLATMLPELVFQSGSVTKGVKMLMQVSGEMAKFYAKKTAGKLLNKDEWHGWADKKEELVLEEMGRRGLLNQHNFMEHADSESVGNNLNIVSQAQKPLIGKVTDSLVAPLKAYSDVSMNVYGSFTKFNTRMATIMGHRLAVAKGLTGEAALESTARFVTQTTFTSGRAGRPPEFYNNSTVGAVLYSLQRYSLSWMSMYAKHLRGAFGDQTRMTELGQGLKGDHKKALATMTAVQFGLAGALGLPFAAALTTVLEEAFGFDIRGRAYNALGQILEEDNATSGGMFADMVMRGGVNALAERVGAPVDFGSRFNLSGLPGMNEFNGFDPGRVFGPSVNVANAMFQGVKGLAVGELAPLAKSAMPVGLRKASEYFINGDALTSKGTKLGLTSDEGALYALGFTPNRIRKTRDAENILQRQSDERQRRDAKAASQVADLVQGNPEEAQRRYAAYIQESGREPRDFAKQVADAHLKAKYPKDVRAGIASADEKRASETLKSMNVQMPQSTQTDQAVDYNKMMQFFGQRPIMSRVQDARQRDAMAAWDPYQTF